MWIIWGFLLTFSAFALEPFERLENVRIVRVLEDNVILMNRGLEDGIMRNDHAKLSSDVEGFTSRAICIKSTPELSYWKIYRVPYAKAFSLDYNYTITGLADREIPFPQASIRDRAQRISDDEKKEDVNPFEIKRDLPEQLTERDLIKAVGLEKRKLYSEQVLSRDQLKRDLEKYQVSIFASPFMKQSINDGESLRYGIRAANVASKYRLQGQVEQQRTKLKDPETKNSVSTETLNGQLRFIIHGISKNFSTLSLLNYNSQKFSSLGTPKSHWQFGPVGLTWHIYESKNWEYFDISYIPLYDVRTTEYINEFFEKTSAKDTSIRHGFRVALKTKISDRVGLENLLWVRPKQDLATWKIEGDDLNLTNDLKLIFNISNNLFFDYNLIYEQDKNWKKYNNLPESNLINSLNLRYDFNI